MPHDGAALDEFDVAAQGDNAAVVQESHDDVPSAATGLLSDVEAHLPDELQLLVTLVPHGGADLAQFDDAVEDGSKDVE